MKQDEIIEMAEGCGFSRTHTGNVSLWLCNKNDLELLIKVATAKEREICAKICDKEQEEWGWDSNVSDAAQKIRERSKK